MKERGSDREKGSAKSCQPEIKQAGTLPIPEPLHPPQSHILPLHSLYLSATASIFRLSRLLSPLPRQRDIFKSAAALHSRSLLLPHTPSYLRHPSRLSSDPHVHAGPRLSGRCSFGLIQASHRAFVCLFVCLPAALEGESRQLREQHTQVLWEKKKICRQSELFSTKEFSVFSQRAVCLCGTAGLKHS